ncbi:MAG: V-type ATP synthase subunit E, partial [Nitrosopumilales archaeon CG_4_10_14_0_8_um_filter_34_8]
MGSNSALEQTIDKILTQTEKDVLSNIHSALSESNKTLDDSIPKLEREYDKIISDGKKEADKIEKQLIGSSDLEARNNKLLILEKAV